MPKLIFDTRFFVEYFYSQDKELQADSKKFAFENRERYVSAVTIHEIYVLTLAKEGRAVARLRLQTIEDLFRVVDVNSKIAVHAAEIRHKAKIPMADGLIAASSKFIDGRCVTDDPHLTSLRDIKTVWF
jgi:predicted nucleic acid-binding protein